MRLLESIIIGFIIALIITLIFYFIIDHTNLNNMDKLFYGIYEPILVFPIAIIATAYYRN